jgi:hypothetical protein
MSALTDLQTAQGNITQALVAATAALASGNQSQPTTYIDGRKIEWTEMRKQLADEIGQLQAQFKINQQLINQLQPFILSTVQRL